jgi:hypothetical protein
MELFNQFIKKREDKDIGLHPTPLHTIEASVIDANGDEFTIALTPDNAVIVEGIDTISTEHGEYHLTEARNGVEETFEFEGLLKLAVFCRMITRETPEQS